MFLFSLERNHDLVKRASDVTMNIEHTINSEMMNSVSKVSRKIVENTMIIADDDLTRKSRE